MRIYLVVEGKRIIRMSQNREVLEEYVQSFPPEERRRFIIVEDDTRDRRGKWLARYE